MKNHSASILNYLGKWQTWWDHKTVDDPLVLVLKYLGGGAIVGSNDYQPSSPIHSRACHEWGQPLYYANLASIRVGCPLAGRPVMDREDILDKTANYILNLTLCALYVIYGVLYFIHITLHCGMCIVQCMMSKVFEVFHLVSTTLHPVT